MSIQRKCLKCNQWSESNGQINERCRHCGELLDEERYTNKAKHLKTKQGIKKETFLLIRHNDSLTKKFFKKSTLIFVGIIIIMVALTFVTHL